MSGLRASHWVHGTVRRANGSSLLLFNVPYRGLALVVLPRMSYHLSVYIDTMGERCAERKPQMLNMLIYSMVYLGSALMVYNIYGFVSFARYIRGRGRWETQNSILYVPIVLLVLFLMGYLAVGIFGKPDLLVAGILFGGSIFVYLMYRFLNRITQRILENERLEAELMAAERSNEAKTTFLASISHEMRTPINVILGLDKLALQDETLGDQTRERLEKIGLSTQHLLGLINNILEINRMEAGELVHTFEQVSLRADVLDQVNALIGTLCEQKGLEFVSSVDDAVFDSVMCDPTQLKQVLLSMLDNAIKYTDAPGRVSFLVGIAPSGEDAVKEQHQAVQFVVSDTGVGMDEEFLGRLFNVFEREDASSTNRHGGSGLSLAVTKSFVDGMGGTICAQSAKNEGSTFTVVIPLEMVPQEEVVAQEEPQVEVSLEGCHILIVEDIPDNAEIVADLLELEGATSDHAQNGEVAVSMFSQSAENYYDAVLMDLRMPVMDGLEATREIRALERSDAKTVPIIALTANAFAEDVKNTADAGMDVHLAKPIDVDLMYETLKQRIFESRHSKGGAVA